MKICRYFWIIFSILYFSIFVQAFGQNQKSRLSEYVLLTMKYQSTTELSELDLKYDIWHVDQMNKNVLVLASKNQLDELKRLGLEFTLEKEKTDKLFAMTFPQEGYRIVEEIYADMCSLAMDYSDLVEVIDYGDSWEKVTSGGKEGYDLYAMTITNKNNPAPKPPIVIDGGIHAREMTPPEVVLEYAIFLLKNYNIDPDVSWMVDYREIHVIPMMNPDGRKKAEQGIWWRKNTNNTDGCTDSLRWGVDLNRNYPLKWGVGSGSSTNPCYDTFRGSAPASEPEIYFYLDYVRSVIPDQRGPNDFDAAPDNAMGIDLNCHSHGNVILHPWGFTSSPPPNLDLITIARKMGRLSGYGYRSSLYAVNGVARDWGYGELGCPSYTIEMGEEFFQPFEDVPEIVQENIRMFLYLTKLTDHPYLSIHGPDVVQLQVSEPAAEQGDTVRINAVVSDFDNGMEIASAAELFIVPIGDTTFQTAKVKSGLQMNLSDSIANSFEEQFEYYLETSNYDPGKYYIFCKGQDINSNWGPFTAQYLTINSPSRVVDINPSIVPDKPILIKNYPNPFNERTTIEISHHLNAFHTGKLNFCIYNITGQVIKEGSMTLAGKNSYTFSWPGKNDNVIPGIYFIRIQSGNSRSMHKLLLVN